MPEFVRQHETDFVRPGPGQQRVVEHEPAGSPESRHIGVRLAGASTGVRDEHLFDRQLRPFGERPQFGRELCVVERAEAIEQRLDQQRRQEADCQHQHGTTARRGDRPGARKTSRRSDEPDERSRGQDEAEYERLDAVGCEAAETLCREAPVPLVDEARPERDRQTGRCRQ